MSLSALAAVKRSRVRAEILIASPVVGLRPIRALLLRLRKIPSPANRSEPSFFSSTNHQRSEFLERGLGLLLGDPDFLSEMRCYLRLRHHPPPWAHICAAASKPEGAVSLLQLATSEKCHVFLRIEQLFQQARHLVVVPEREPTDISVQPVGPAHSESNDMTGLM